MTAVLRSELHRLLSIRSSRISMAVIAALGLFWGWFSADFWALFAGLGAFGIAVVATAQHYQHRTAVLLYLGSPRRLRALTGQVLAVMVIAVAVAVVSGGVVLSAGETSRFTSTVAAVPLMALYGVANAVIVRRSTWLFIGYGGWLLFVEGLIGKLEQPLPFSSFLLAGSGDHRHLAIFAGWTGLALIGAVLAVNRDLAGD